MTIIPVTKHPAKFSPEVLARIADLLDDYGWPLRILDPFAGVGRVHGITASRTYGIEIEPEWAANTPNTIAGNALHLPFADATFDGMVTSPCLAQEHRILTDDLMWRWAGDIEVGDRVLAFDEDARNGVHRGVSSRRRWQRAEVVRSEPKTVECVRVVLANGDEIITTPEHPWLAYRYSYGGVRAQWAQSKDLLAMPWVLRQMEPWKPRLGYDAGWLAGFLDGEGSLSLGGSGAPKLACSQVQGPIADHAEKLMHEFGYEPNRIIRTKTPAHCQKVANLYVTGGFPGMFRALGELRPRRLLAKWEGLDISGRTVQADKVQVLAVEPAGRRDIQEIETTAGTYFGEGYLMHNCYGNRFSDSHRAKDPSERRSYTHDLRAGTGDSERDLHSDNAGTLAWGPKYQAFHDRAWTEVLRTLTPASPACPRGALIIVNVSNFYKTVKGQLVEQHVAEWHHNWFLDHGCAVVDFDAVATKRFKKGANRDQRAAYEFLFVLRYVAPVLTPDEETLDDVDQRPHTPHRTGLAGRVDAADGPRIT